MSDFVLIPYIQIDGSWTIPDELMKGLYRLMVQEGTAEKVFYSGSVLNEDHFLSACKSPGQHTLVILQQDGSPGGIVWLNGFMGASAQIHFCMFKAIWGTRTVEAGKKAVNYFFGLTKPDGEPLFKVLLGLTPAEYRVAIRFIKEVGVTVLGTIPHFLYHYFEKRTMGAVVSYLERRD